MKETHTNVPGSTEFVPKMFMNLERLQKTTTETQHGEQDRVNTVRTTSMNHEKYEGD